MAATSRSQFATENQLSLFPEATDGELTDNLEKEFVDERNGYAHTPRASDRSPGVDGQPATTG